MNINVDSIVRSAAVVVVGLPLVLSLNNLVNVTANLAEKSVEKEVKVTAVDDLHARLVEPCLKYLVSKEDSKLERTGKNEIDEVIGGEGNHQEICDWVF